MLLDRDDGAVRFLEHDAFPFPVLRVAVSYQAGQALSRGLQAGGGCEGPFPRASGGILGSLKCANMSGAACQTGCERADNNRSPRNARFRSAQGTGMGPETARRENS